LVLDGFESLRDRETLRGRCLDEVVQRDTLEFDSPSQKTKTKRLRASAS
jgi:hypothetical protein